MEDAFHVVLPALPGFGFSDKPRDTGVGVPKIAEMWEALMSRLGYQTYHAHGGDWGSIVTQAILMQQNTRCAAGRCTLPLVPPDMSTMDKPLPEEIDAVASFQFYTDWDSVTQNSRALDLKRWATDSLTRPQGKWQRIVEKFAYWMDCERNNIRHPENVLSKDATGQRYDVLDDQLRGLVASSILESNSTNMTAISRPIGLSVFPKEICAPQNVGRAVRAANAFQQQL